MAARNRERVVVRAAVYPHRGQDPSTCILLQKEKVGTNVHQGFDEFMNLVIDDAVEVKQITKTNDKETRRSLGSKALCLGVSAGSLTLGQVKSC